MYHKTHRLPPTPDFHPQDANSTLLSVMTIKNASAEMGDSMARKGIYMLSPVHLIASGGKMIVIKTHTWSSLVVQQVEDLALSLLKFNPWPGSLHMPRAQHPSKRCLLKPFAVPYNEEQGIQAEKRNRRIAFHTQHLITSPSYL